MTDTEITEEERQIVEGLLEDMKKNYYEAQGSDGYGYIVDSEANTIFHPDKQLVGTNLMEYEFMQEIIKQKNGYIEYEWKGEMKVAAFHELPNGHIFAVSSYLHDMLKSTNKIERDMFIISILGAIAAVLAGAFIVNQITKPIKSVVEAMKKAEEGDLTVGVPVYSRDEVGQISVMYNSMIQKLKGILTEIHEASEQVAASSEELTASAGENTRASEQIASAAEEISRSSQDQVERVGVVVESIHDISGAISQTKNNVSQVKEDAQIASQFAEEGASNLAEVVEEMEDITTKVRKTEEVIRELGGQSKSIMGIITTITDISEQTNLLALNAAIEAARAGEQGKSFAVVAGEVRKLAEQSRKAASEIADLILMINDEIKDASYMMEESSKAVSEGGAVVSTAGQSFRKIKQSVNDVYHEMESLTGAIKQINDDATRIVENADEISNLAGVSAGDTEEVAAASEEQMATMEEINAASQMLANMADHLQEQVNQFKITK
ncbi:methyl-accepting chemotaxis protein [Bacillus tianshenii]|nr:methyl-accepting chemotaxis protein [Bacillus tianshenii]